MLNTTNSNSEYLHNYIRKVAKQEQESVDISSVYTGTIEAAQSGIYTIVLNQSDNSSSVLAIPIVSGDIYDRDDSVYLLRANTTATVNYFIVGKVNAIQEAFFNLTELERFNPNESKVDLSFGSNDFISISEDANNIFNSINALGYFQLEVKITSKVEDGAKIIIYLNYTDKSHYGAKFVFSSYEFIGQPGGNNYTLVQKKIFHLSSNINIKNIRIEKVGDFSVAAMNIVAGSLLEVSAAYQNDIVVQNDRNYFEKEIPNVSNPLNTVTLTSKIYYNNKPLVGEALQYYWFLKDDSAVDPISSDYYNIEGAGNGWRCLNTFTSATTADEEKIRLWDNKNNFIVLNKTNEFVNFSNFVNKVKCIVKYFDNFIESDLIDIYNYDYEQFSAILQSTVDNNILAYKDDKIILQCEVLNDNEKIDNSKYSIEYRWYIKGRNADESDLNITAKNEKNEDILTYSSLTIYDSAYTNTLQKGEYKLAKGKTEEEFYCVVTIIPKGTKEGYHSEQTNIVKVRSNAAAADITQSTEYKYYISNEHNITFKQGVKQEEGQLSEWNGDWEINIKDAIWVGPVGVDYNTVFSSFDIFKQYKEDEEQFVYYTQRSVWRERDEVFKTENWSFPQIARSVININGWKNHRVGDNVNQLNTFNQLSDNGKEDGIYYADIAKITTDDTPDWGTKYYERNVSPDGEISYTLISLEANIHFKKDQDYYIYNSEKEQYELVLSNTDYDKSTEYYEKINDNEYQKLIVNTQNFDITNVAWPSNKAGPFYTNIDNKLLINASYIRSGTLEVKDKFYASIDQEDVRIAGFNVNETTLESKNGSVGLNSDNSDLSNIAIWAGTKNGEKHPFQVTHEGKLNATEANIEGTIRATELYIGTSQTSLIQANSNILGFNSDNFYIYSNNLKLNYNEGYSKGYFKIETTNFGIDETGNARIAGTIEATSGRIGDNDKKILICDGEWLLYNENFSVSEDGILNANNAIIEGTINASGGTIGGFHIAGDHLADGEDNDGNTDNHLVMLSPGLKKNEGDDAGYVFWAGQRKPGGDDSSRPFWIKNDGSFNSTKGTIGNVSIEDSGLKIYDSNKNLAVSFSKDGILLSESIATLQIGKAYFNSDSTGDYLYTNRKFILSSNNKTTSLTLSDSGGKSETPYIITINGGKVREAPSIWQYDGGIMSLKLTSNVALLNDTNFTIYYVYKSSSNAVDKEIVTANITIKAGAKESDFYRIYASNYDTGINKGAYVKVGFSWDSVQGELTDKDLNYPPIKAASTGDYATMNVSKTFTQAESTNNIILKGNLLPEDSKSYSLGSTNKSWNIIYVNSINGVPWSTIKSKLNL